VLKKDQINPDHYKAGKVECIDALETVASLNPESKEVVSQCNAIKYLWRYNNKHDDPLTDLYKSRWYLTRLIELVEKRLEKN
jgi:hypothetical protein|tara:strand:- start:290 stop:535 length:246 start_codon:yes stop_codon:yes gene_type:complete